MSNLKFTGEVEKQKQEFEVKRFSAQKFNDETDIAFDPEKYSRFKYGCGLTAKEFGIELATKFLQDKKYMVELIYQLEQGKRIIVMSSPYIHIPTATVGLMKYFVQVLNAWLADNGYQPAITTKISRAQSYKQDYGAMSKEQRHNTMNNDIFHVDRQVLSGNICLYLDDIVITGAHESRVRKMIDHYEVEASHYFLYYAELLDPDYAPQIENYLNYMFIGKDLKAMSQLVKEGNFIFNTRSVKFILDKSKEVFEEFINEQTPDFLSELYHEALGNFYQNDDFFPENCKILRAKVRG